MINKICTKCKKGKKISDFHKSKTEKYGCAAQCKECRNKKNRNRYKKCNKIKITKKKTKICSKCGKRKNINNFHKRKDNKDGRKSHCKDCRSKKFKNKYKSNAEFREKTSINAKKYNSTFRGKETAKKRKIKYLSVIENKLHFNISSLIRHHLKGNTKESSILKYLPYTFKKLKIHLESLFIDGMSWDNYGEWEIDHLIPFNNLKYKSLNDKNFKKCWSLSNLHPMWQTDNASKGDTDILEWFKINPSKQFLYLQNYLKLQKIA